MLLQKQWSKFEYGDRERDFFKYEVEVGGYWQGVKARAMVVRVTKSAGKLGE